MVKVKVKHFILPGNLKEESLNIDKNNPTVEDLLETLIDKYGNKFKEYVLDEKGFIQRGLLVSINGELIHWINAPKTKIRENDFIILLPGLSGG